jgi:hypothetical protein
MCVTKKSDDKVNVWGAASCNLFVEWSKMVDHRKSTSSLNAKAKRLSDP